MRFLSLLLVVSFVCFADAQATVKVVSKRNPGISWECLVPVANDDTTKPELGSCMPEALCDSKTGTSKWKNVFGLKDYNGVSYDYKCAFFGGKTALPVWFGWFIVVGLGAIFAIFFSVLQWLHDRQVQKQSVVHSSEHFAGAGRSVPSGWIACKVVAMWTWAASLLQSSNVAYKYGISGPFWYASGATIQVLLFAVLAVEIKRKCPAIHTICEVILARWGVAAHLTIMCFVIATQCKN
jgi:hypothetical protein